MTMTNATQPERSPAARAVDRWLDAIEAVLWLGLLVFGSVVAIAVFREYQGTRPPEHLVAPSGLIEAEQLGLAGKSREFSFWLQPTTSFTGGRWSEDGQMLAVGTESGDWLEFELPERDPGKQRLEIFFTKAADYGIVAVSLNGTALGQQIDLFSDRGVVPTGAIDLGVVDLHRQGDMLRVTVVGANERTAPPHFQFGMDGIRLGPP
jgi:hypothetical protein